MPTKKHGLLVTAAAFAASLSAGPALSEEVPDQLHAPKLVIRAALLGTAEWAYEWGQSPDHADPHGARGKLNRGRAWFAEKNGKLIGYIDDGLKCESEVALRPDGFDMATCSDGDKHFVRSGEQFEARFGSYTYAIRPPP